MSLAEYKKRKQKLKPKSHEPERRSSSSAIAKAPVPVSSKTLINSPPPPPPPPPTASKQATKSGFSFLLIFRWCVCGLDFLLNLLNVGLSRLMLVLSLTLCGSCSQSLLISQSWDWSVYLATTGYRDVTKFKFKFDDVRTSNVFTKFEIWWMFLALCWQMRIREKSLFYDWFICTDSQGAQTNQFFFLIFNLSHKLQ